MSDAPRERTYTWSDPREVTRAVLASENQSWMQELLRGKFPAPGISSLLGMTLESIDDDGITFAMHAHEWTANPAGLVHGGMASTLLDTALTLCVIAKLPTGKMSTTLNLNVTFVRPLFPTGEKITARAWPLHIGTTVATSQGQLHDSRNRLIAHATATLSIIDTAALLRTLE